MSESSPGIASAFARPSPEVAKDTLVQTASSELPPQLHVASQKERVRSHESTSEIEEARKKIFETIRPSPEVAEQMKHLLESEAAKLVENTDAKTEQIVQAVVGIELWRFGVHDTGASLPLGLINDIYGSYPYNSTTPPIDFDANVLTARDYQYVVKHLDGPLHTAVELHHKDLQTREGEIAKTFETYLHKSSLMTCLNSFGVTSQEVAEREIQVKDPEYMTRNAQRLGMLTHTFGEENPDESLRPDVRDAATRSRNRLDQSTVDRKLPKGGKGRDSARERFRAWFGRDILKEKIDHEAGKYKSPTVRDLQVKDGQLIAIRIHDGKEVPMDYELDIFAYFRTIGRLDSDPHSFGWEYPTAAFKKIATNLYDRSDTRTWNEIIEDGIQTTSQEIAKEIVTEPYHSLLYSSFYEKDKDRHKENFGSDAQMRSIDGNDRRMLRTAWLNGVISPVSKEGDRMHIMRVRDSLYIHEDITSDEKRYYEVPAKIVSTKEDIFAGEVPRMVTTTLLRDRDNIPSIPPEDPDLVLRGSNTYEVSGMTLVARDGSLQYFQNDPENTLNQPVDSKVPAIRYLEVADYVEEHFGMNTLAKEIRDNTDMTIDQLITHMRSYCVQTAIPEHLLKDDDVDGLSFGRKSHGIKEFVHDDGKLYGPRVVFREFFHNVLDITLAERDRVTPHYYDSQGMPLVQGHEYTGRSISAVKIEVEGQEHIVPSWPLGASLYEEYQPPEPYTRKSDSERSYEPGKRKNGTSHEGSQSENNNLNENELTLMDREAIEKQINTHIAKVMFVNHEEVFRTVTQLLINKQPINESVQSFVDQQDYTGTMPDLVIKGLLPEFANEDEDPTIAGMKLTGRYLQNGETFYFFTVDHDDPKYVRLETPIDEEKRQKVASFFRRMNMPEFADQLQADDELTIARLGDLITDRTEGIVSDEDQNIVIERPEDLLPFVTAEGKIQGMCTFFEWTYRNALGEAFGHENFSSVGGLVLTPGENINMMSHAQTATTLNDGQQALLNVPYTIASLGYTEPRAREITRPLVEKRPIRIGIVDSSSSFEKANDSIDMVFGIHTLKEQLLKEAQNRVAKKDAQKADTQQVDEDEKKEELVEASLPQPEAVSPEDQKTIETILLKNELKAATEAFRLQLTVYLGMPSSGDMLDFRGWSEQVMRKIGSQMRSSNNWKSLPHISLYNLLRHQDIYQDDKDAQTLAGDPLRARLLDDISYASTLKSRLERRGELARRGLMPAYDETFASTMVHLIDVIEKAQQEGYEDFPQKSDVEAAKNI